MSEPEVLELVNPTHVLDRARRLVYFGGSDYLRLSWHPWVRAALVRAARRRCINVASSRLTTGNDPIFSRLEAGLAQFLGFEAATLTSAGYTAPLAVAQALEGHFTHALVDEKAHGCLHDAAIFVGARTSTFRHDDPEDLALRARKLGRRSRLIVLTDGLSPLEGTVPPLQRYLKALPRSATLLVDDAHGVGVLGDGGRGVLELLGVEDPRVVLTLTLSKTLGCQGGVVLGSSSLRSAIWERSRVFASSTPLPLPIAETAQIALRILRNSRIRRNRLQTNVKMLGEAFSACPPGSPGRPGPMFTVAPESDAPQEALRHSLLEAGIYPVLIRYANGPADRFFRFAVSSEHTKAQIVRLRDVLAEHFSRYPLRGA